MPVPALSPAQLYTVCDDLSFETTDDLEDLHGALGQERALRAIEFGTGIEQPGYNIFVLGPSQTGRHALTLRYLQARASGEATPHDWVYVNNFSDEQKPVAIPLPCGTATRLRDRMRSLIDDLRTALPAMFEGEEYTRRAEAINDAFRQRQEEAFEGLQEKARTRNVVLMRTPMGLALAPLKDGEVIKPEALEAMAEEERSRIQSDLEALQQELTGILRQLPAWDKHRRDQLRELNREMATFAVDHSIDEAKAQFEGLPDVLVYLDAVRRDVMENVAAFLPRPDSEQGAADPLPARGAAGFHRYDVNVVVDNSGCTGAPVVYEDLPTVQNLTGRIEHISQMGALVTYFGLIRAGALHRANGGYLVLDARKLLSQPFAWETLKRVLDSGRISVETLSQLISPISTLSLEPEPIPLDIKVVLFGEREIYYLLQQADPEFDHLFKIAADFDDRFDRTAETTRLYAQFIATTARRYRLRPFDRPAVMRLVEHAARLVDDAERLTAEGGRIADLMREADHCALLMRAAVVGRDHVQRAIEEREHRIGRIRERAHEAIQRGLMLIDTAGTRVGQINGLAVSQIGALTFGKPSRITARARIGNGEVVDIEREVELGGPIHSKGVLILANYLGAHFAPDRPLSLKASLVFEQSYAGVEGDSASCAELYALLSTLSGLPIRQALAVTGSVNQYGEVQVIGGVNEKIEGFFDICSGRGLTGEQGVLIPAGNVQHLMLRQDVVAAAGEGRFHVYAVRTIAQGIELLTGVAAGERGDDGLFPAGTVFRRVEDRLIELADARRRFGARDAAQPEPRLP
ncbi:MAG: AAA family ATPase [Acetobacterales bacterium]